MKTYDKINHIIIVLGEEKKVKGQKKDWMKGSVGMGIYLNPGNKGFGESIRSRIYVDKTNLIVCTNEVINTQEVLRELPTVLGFADIVFLPLPHTKTPAIVVELKYDKTANTAIRQIKDRHYTQALEEYNGEILLVGINYDKNNENKPHSCIIEKLQKEHTC